MRNITFSADEDLIEQARLTARSHRESLNDAFRRWLIEYTVRGGSGREYDALMKRLQYVRAGRRFSRDEMNER